MITNILRRLLSFKNKNRKGFKDASTKQYNTPLKEMTVVVEYSNWGMGSTYIQNSVAYITVNKNLPKWEYLYAHIISHEKEHIKDYQRNKTLFTFRNFIEELKEFQPKLIAYFIVFYIRYPKALTEFLPVKIDKGKVLFKPFLIFVYLLFLFSFLF